MPWCCNTTQLNIYYLHSISTQQRDLFFPGRGGGTQVCKSCIETDSWAGDVGALLGVNRTRRTPLHTTLDSHNWNGRRENNMEKEMFGVCLIVVLDMWLTWEHCIRGYTEVNSPVCHKFRPMALSWSTQQRSHDRLSAQYFFLPPSSFDWFKIMVVSLTVSPAWLTPLALVGSAAWLLSWFFNPHCPPDSPGDIWPLCLAVMTFGVL